MNHNKDSLYYKAWRRLPERFRKTNNLDLYYVLYGGYDEIEKGFADINESRNIDKAKGDTLDKLGANVGQFRLGEDDELYRQLIKVRIIANMSIGDIPTINRVMSALVKDVYLGLEEVWMSKDNLFEPAAIKLKLGPMDKRISLEIIDKIKAAGVRVLLELNYKHELFLGSGVTAGELITILPPKLEDMENIKLVSIATSIYTQHENITIGRRV